MLKIDIVYERSDQVQYMIVFDDRDRSLIDETLNDKVERLREDGDAANDRLADRLEALVIVPVPTSTPQDADQASEALSVSPLLAEIINASMGQAAATNQALIDSLQWEVDRLNASLNLIRATVEELYSHPWSPRSFHVLGALYPDRYAIKQTAANLAIERGRRYEG